MSSPLSHVLQDRRLLRWPPRAPSGARARLTRATASGWLVRRVMFGRSIQRETRNRAEKLSPKPPVDGALACLLAHVATAKRGSSSIVQRQRRFLRRDLELEPRPARHRAPGASAEANGASAEHDLGAGWPEQLEAVSVGYQTSAAIVNERTDPLRLSRPIGWCLRRAPSTSARSRSMLVLESKTRASRRRLPCQRHA